MRKINFIYCFIMCLSLIACDSQKKKLESTMKQMQTVPIDIPYDEMTCWSNDSTKKNMPWTTAKFKLVHYVDSVQCSTCYLSKKELLEDVLNLESESNGIFSNVFIVEPGTKKTAIKLLSDDYTHKLTPQTLFIDTEGAFIKKNPVVPKNEIFHTFLLDENNKVIFVGNLLIGEHFRRKLIIVIKDQLSKGK